jgi:two-component system nitrogen regulation response regulator GlnG
VLFDFPGNVRQLENMCHWLTVMAPAQVVEPKDLPPEIIGAAATQSLRWAPAMPPLVPPPLSQAAPATASTASSPVSAAAAPTGEAAWLTDLEREARSLLEVSQPQVWDQLTRQFEARLIQTALSLTKGRRIEAAHKLGIGRNTITRKIQELGLE